MSKKTVALLGATGLTGSHILRECLSTNKYHVRALVRDPTKVTIQDPNLLILHGDANNVADVQNLIRGSQIVISALSGPLLSDQCKIAANIAKQEGANRFVLICGAGILQQNETTLLRDNPHFPAVIQGVTEIHLTNWKTLQELNLDYTCLCPPVILEKEKCGNYKFKLDYVPEGASEVCAGDIAHLIVREVLEEKEYIQRRVGICN